MKSYLDAFLFPIAKAFVEEYQAVAEQVAQVWLDHGALTYQEYLGDELDFPGTQSFKEAVQLAEHETLIIGWTSFPSKEIRDAALKAVSQDPRMESIVGPLMDSERLIFDAQRMLFSGFRPLVQKDKSAP